MSTFDLTRNKIKIDSRQNNSIKTSKPILSEFLPNPPCISEQDGIPNNPNGSNHHPERVYSSGTSSELATKFRSTQSFSAFYYVFSLRAETPERLGGPEWCTASPSTDVEINSLSLSVLRSCLSQLQTHVRLWRSRFKWKGREQLEGSRSPRTVFQAQMKG